MWVITRLLTLDVRSSMTEEIKSNDMERVVSSILHISFEA